MEVPVAIVGGSSMFKTFVCDDLRKLNSLIKTRFLHIRLHYL